MSVAVFSSLAVDLGCSHRKLRRQRAWLRPFVPAEWQGRYPGRSYWRWPEGGPLKAKEVLCAQTWSILSIKKRSAQTLWSSKSRQALSGRKSLLYTACPVAVEGAGAGKCNRHCARSAVVEF